MMKNYNLSKKIENPLEDKPKSIIFYGLLILGATVIMVAPLIHKWFPKENKEVIAYEKKLNSKIDIIDTKLSNLKEDYNNDLIEPVNFIDRQKELLLLKMEQEAVNEILYRKKVDEERIFGWLAIDIFLVAIGIRLPYLLFAFIVSWLISKIDTSDNKYLKRTFLYIQIICYASAFYQIIWCFWYSQDYPLSTYLVFAIALCLLLATVFVYFINYREVFKLKLITVIHLLFKGYYEDLEKQDLIDPNKTKAYKLYRMRLTDKVVEHEQR